MTEPNVEIDIIKVDINPNDTWESVASRYGVSADTLIAENLYVYQQWESDPYNSSLFSVSMKLDVPQAPEGMSLEAIYNDSGLPIGTITDPYLYEDEGVGSEIDVAILQNALDKIKKQEALGTAITYFDLGIENPALHAFFAETQNRGTDYPLETVEKDYQLSVLSSLMELYVQSEDQVDLSLLSEAIDFNDSALDGGLNGLVQYYYHLKYAREDVPSIDPYTYLLSSVDTIDFVTIQSLLVEQIFKSQGTVPKEDLLDAVGLLNDYADAVAFDENYEAILAQAIADVDAWDGEAEQQLLDELWAKIEIMHTTGGFVAGQPVGNIIGAFERYHKAMIDHQTTRAYWAELKDQLDYLNLSEEGKIDYYKDKTVRGYLDHFKFEYDAETEYDQLFDLMLDDLRANPDHADQFLPNDISLHTDMHNEYFFRAFRQEDNSLYLSQAQILDSALYGVAYGQVYQAEQQLLGQLILFFAGFVPILGQAMDVLDFVTALARGDMAGAVWNLIPMIGDAVAGCRRIARKGDSLYNAYKASYPDMTDVTDKIDELEGVTRRIEDQKQILGTMARKQAKESGINRFDKTVGESPEEVKNLEQLIKDKGADPHNLSNDIPIDGLKTDKDGIFIFGEDGKPIRIRLEGMEIINADADAMVIAVRGLDGKRIITVYYDNDTRLWSIYHETVFHVPQWGRLVKLDDSKKIDIGVLFNETSKTSKYLTNLMELEPRYHEVNILGKKLGANNDWVEGSQEIYNESLKIVQSKEFVVLYQQGGEFAIAVDAIAENWTGELGQIYKGIKGE